MEFLLGNNKTGITSKEITAYNFLIIYKKNMRWA